MGPPKPCSAPSSLPATNKSPAGAPAAHPRGIWAPLPTGSQDDGKVIHINRVQHQAVRVGLGEPIALPCLFLLHPSASLGPNEPPDPPRVKWSKVRSATGQREDVPILVAKDNAVKVVKAYEGRVSLPGYPRDRYNATLVLRAARASDAGLYRCEVVAGIDDEQDLLPLEVTGEPGAVTRGGIAGRAAGGDAGTVAGWRGCPWGSCVPYELWTPCKPCTPCAPYTPCKPRTPRTLCKPCTLCSPRTPCVPCKPGTSCKP